jgi:hypothetical protein
MPAFVQNAEAKIRLESYQNTVRFNSDVDSFSEQSTLTLAQARAIMQYLHNNNVKTIGFIGPIAITLHVGETVQYKAMAYRSPDSINIPTLGALADDITAIATWLKNPVAATVTVSNGLITAAVIGVIGVYVKLGDLQSTEITVTVVA